MSTPLQPAGPALARMFFALWPPPAVQRTLGGLADTCARQVRGRAVAEVNLHVTLAFLGEIPPPAVKAVSEAAAAVEFEPFALTIDRLGFWRRTGIVWAGTRECPRELRVLAGDLRERLARLGFPPEHREFQPHVTLMRRANRRPRLAMEALHWPVESFCLVRSLPGAHGSEYHVEAAWPQR